MNKKYKTIYADPPWNESGGGVCKRGADKHYDLMTTEEIINMKNFIVSLCDDNCHLYLWVTNNFLQDGLIVMKEWGFRYITCITWLKSQIGLGQYFRGITEHCLFGSKGQLPYKIINNKRQQGVTGFYEVEKEHSVKPHYMRCMIETVSYPPYLEVFAREKHLGWDVYGNEISNVIVEDNNNFEVITGR